jgi:hypothetical protein
MTYGFLPVLEGYKSYLGCDNNYKSLNGCNL